jgi:hypothetical protein
MTKPKIFVRYSPGASGHFIATLIFSLQRPLRLKNPLSGHENADLLASWHNFNNQFNNTEFNRNTTIGVDLQKSTNYIKENFKFDDDANPYQFFVIHTHVVNPDPLINAYEKSKLINIVTDDDDSNQLAYNFVIKNVIPHSWQTRKSLVEHFKNNNPNKLINLTAESIKPTDVKLLTYLEKFSQERKIKQRAFHKVNYEHFEIKWKDIVDKTLITKLDALCEYLQIELTDAKRSLATTLINQYADAQIMCPWNLTLDDFT